jgi:glutamyl-tRNA reductase
VAPSRGRIASQFPSGDRTGPSLTMRVFLLGVSHQTAPVELRERLDFSSRDVGDAVRAFADRATATEAVLLSTCNRSEVYAVTGHPETARAEIVDFLAAYHDLPAETFVPHLVERIDVGSIRGSSANRKSWDR